MGGCSKDLPSLNDVSSAPQVTIVEPEDGTQALEGTTLVFLAVAEDAGGGELSLAWTSDRDGPLLTDGLVDSDGNAQLATASLTPGFHAVSIKVTDRDGDSAQDSVNVRITDVLDAPELTIDSPAIGQTGTEGVPFPFVVRANDPQDSPSDLLVQLESSQSGYICALPIDSSGEGRCTSVMSLGTHLLTFTAADTDGYITEATTYFDVLPNLDIDDDRDGWTIAAGDCDDANAGINPDEVEVPYDGIDQDCNAGDVTDLDGDGYDADVVGGPDCNDVDVQISPGQPEVVYDGIDNDCNPLTSDNDADGDGWIFGTDCNDNDPLAWPGAVEAPYDGSDNDCDPATLDDDLDLDGYPLVTDCDDGNAIVHPGAGEILYDGFDNDCSALTPDDDLDGDGYLLVDDCDDSDPSAHPLAIEVAYDGVDNDCVGGDECDVDNDGYGSTSPLCGGQDCDDGNFAISCSLYYNDLDGDGWGVGELCACGPTGTYTALVPGDCYDFSTNVYPGQAQYFTVNRGDGSFDYNCASGEEKLDPRPEVWDCDVDYVPILDIIIDIDFDGGWIGHAPVCGEIGTYASTYTVTTTGFDAQCDPDNGINSQQRCR